MHTVRIPANFEPRLTPSQQAALRQLAAANHTHSVILMIDRYRANHRPLRDYMLRHQAMLQGVKKVNHNA
jgi:hypothetical protein